MTHPTNNQSNRDTLRNIHLYVRFAGAVGIGYSLAKHFPADDSVFSKLSAIGLATILTLKGTEMLSPKIREGIAVCDAGFSAVQQPMGSKNQGLTFVGRYLFTRTLLTPTDELFPPISNDNPVRFFQPRALVPLSGIWWKRTNPSSHVVVGGGHQTQQPQNAPQAVHRQGTGGAQSAREVPGGGHRGQPLQNAPQTVAQTANRLGAGGAQLAREVPGGGHRGQPPQKAPQTVHRPRAGGAQAGMQRPSPSPTHSVPHNPKSIKRGEDRVPVGK